MVRVENVGNGTGCERSRELWLGKGVEERWPREWLFSVLYINTDMGISPFLLLPILFLLLPSATTTTITTTAAMAKATSPQFLLTSIDIKSTKRLIFLPNRLSQEEYYWEANQLYRLFQINDKPHGAQTFNVYFIPQPLAYQI